MSLREGKLAAKPAWMNLPPAAAPVLGGGILCWPYSRRPPPVHNLRISVALAQAHGSLTDVPAGRAAPEGAAWKAPASPDLTPN